MKRMRDRYGPWALITGASSGIGASFARELAARRFNLVLVARREERLRQIADDLQNRYSISTQVIVADLARDDFMAVAERGTEGLDIGLLVNNAGTGEPGNFLSSDLDEELQMLNLNCRAPLILTHSFGRAMRQRGRGGVIFLSSVVAFAGMPAWSSYAATKAQNLIFAEGLSAELERDGVDVLAICPGFTRTELLALTGLGRLLSIRPRRVARLALHKLGRKRRVTAGLISKAIVLSTRFQPRALNTWIFGTVFNTVRDRKAGRRSPVVHERIPIAPSPETVPMELAGGIEISGPQVMEEASAPEVVQEWIPEQSAEIPPEAPRAESHESPPIDTEPEPLEVIRDETAAAPVPGQRKAPRTDPTEAPETPEALRTGPLEVAHEAPPKAPAQETRRGSREEPPGARAVDLIGAHDDGDRSRVRRQRKRYTPPPKSAIKNK